MILKKGSRGQEVKQLQLNIGISPADGIFGPGTERALILWQQKYGLVPDGIAGTKTFNKIKELSLSKPSPTNTVSKDKFINHKLLHENAYFRGPTKKEWVFLHHTAGWHNPYNIVNDWNSRTSKVATEFIIGGQSILGNDTEYDGEIVKCIPNGGYAWHLGIGNRKLHTHSVGIELCNFGGLTAENKTWAGQIVTSSQITELTESFRGYTKFQKYSDKQLKSLHKLLLYIAELDNIDIRNGLPQLIKAQGIKAFDITNITMCNNEPGLWSHTNVVKKGKWDVYPQPELIDMLLSL